MIKSYGVHKNEVGLREKETIPNFTLEGQKNVRARKGEVASLLTSQTSSDGRSDFKGGIRWKSSGGRICINNWGSAFPRKTKRMASQ